MFKSRRKILEEEAKKDKDYVPTKNLHVDESKLSDEEKSHTHFPWSALIIGGGILLLMIVCIVVICVLGPNP